MYNYNFQGLTDAKSIDGRIKSKKSLLPGNEAQDGLSNSKYLLTASARMQPWGSIFQNWFCELQFKFES